MNDQHERKCLETIMSSGVMAMMMMMVALYGELIVQLSRRALTMGARAVLSSGAVGAAVS